jgi:hypothetical protein
MSHSPSLVSKVLMTGASLLLTLNTPYSFSQESQQVYVSESGALVYSDAGRYIPFRWHDGTNMKAIGAKSISLGNGVYAVVVVGGDGTLLYRLGQLSRAFFNGTQSGWLSSPSAGWFTWRKTEKDHRMKVNSISSLSRLGNGDLRIVVVGGDGRQCTLDSSPRLLSQSDYRFWDCI